MLYTVGQPPITATMGKIQRRPAEIQNKLP